MRLPCIRFTVGKLLLAIAVVAANCGILRFLYEMVAERHGGLVVPTLPLHYCVGFLPLLNVALVGTFLVVAGRLPSSHRRRAARPRSAPAGITYFSLHFLGLGCVVSLFEPEAIERYLNAFAPLWNYAEKGWSVLFERFGDAFPWLVLEVTIVSVFLSGPLLLLSWIGRMVARHCAATPPPRRFQAMTGLVSFAFAVAALAVSVTPRPFTEDQDVALDFQVVDQDSGRPIGAAFVQISDPFDERSSPPRALTVADGHARLTGRFQVNGERSAFQTFGVFTPWGRWFEASAAGYRTRRIPLTEVLGPSADPDRPQLERVALTRGQTPGDSCSDIAGTYSTRRPALNGRRCTILRDGRFAWVEWSCTYNYGEYGHLKRNGGEIHFVPVPHPGEERHPLMTAKYRTIEWGDRLYLGTTNDQALQEFCREALTVSRPRDSVPPYGSYIRDSDCPKPPTGLPRLPVEVWVKFLLGEMSLQNEEGGLRLALESLVPRSLRGWRAFAPDPQHSLESETPDAE